MYDEKQFSDVCKLWDIYMLLCSCYTYKQLKNVLEKYGPF